MIIKNVSQNYGTHSYERDYKKTELYCPNCGKQEVWEESGGGDYDKGTEHICIACSHNSFLDSFKTDHPEVVEQIKAGVAKSDKEVGKDFLSVAEVVDPLVGELVTLVLDKFKEEKSGIKESKD